jgi:hypothetical protein
MSLRGTKQSQTMPIRPVQVAIASFLAMTYQISVAYKKKKPPKRRPQYYIKQLLPLKTATSTNYAFTRST